MAVLAHGRQIQSPRLLAAVTRSYEIGSVGGVRGSQKEPQSKIALMIAELIELVARIWHADSEIRDRSLLGESELDQRSRRFVAWLCGGTIVVLVLAGIAWWWFTRQE